MGFGFSFKDLEGMGSAAMGGLVKNVPNLLDPSGSRLAVAGLLQGGRRNTQKGSLTEVGFATGKPNGEVIPIEKDWRIRVSIARESGIFYHGNAGIMSPLRETQGVIFPYTPSITTSYSAAYSSVKPTHSNYASYFYENSEVQNINISGEFTVQNIPEGQYLLACIYFFRAASKMFYGTGPKVGNPPPILFLDGYGSHILPHVPCILTQFQHTYDKEVDYIEIPSIVDIPTNKNIGGNSRPGTTSTNKGPFNRLPTNSTIQIGLQPVYSRSKIAEFDLEKFARGDLINKGFL